MESVIAYPKNAEQLATIKAFMKALKISFEIDKSPYRQEFVSKIKEAEKRGKYKDVDVNDIWGSLNLK